MRLNVNFSNTLSFYVIVHLTRLQKFYCHWKMTYIKQFCRVFLTPLLRPPFLLREKKQKWQRKELYVSCPDHVLSLFTVSSLQLINTFLQLLIFRIEVVNTSPAYHPSPTNTHAHTTTILYIEFLPSILQCLQSRQSFDLLFFF